MMITREQALQILEINDPYPSIENIRKQYRIMALRYHPDKPTGSEQSFHKLTEAYELLQKIDGGDSGVFSTFFDYLFKNYKTDKIILDLIDKLVTFCENKSLSLFENIDKQILIKIMEIVELHAPVLGISELFIDELQKIIDKKTVLDEHIILHPFIEDIFADNIYKMTLDGNLYLIPLWHHELIYDLPDITTTTTSNKVKKELCIECFPILPENISIDSKNNIHCTLIKNISDIWELDEIPINIGNQTCFIKTDMIYLRKIQTIILYRQGISRINTYHIYDNSQKGDVYVHIKLDI